MRNIKPWLVYAVAIAATAVAALLRAAYDQWFGAEPAFIIPFLLPVVVAGLYGGVRCGLVTLALNTFVIAYYFTDPIGSVRIANFNDAVRVAVFAAVGAGVSVLAGRVHHRRRADEHASEASGHRRDAAAWHESEARLRLLLESLPQLVWTCTPDGRCDYLSRQWVEYTGVPAAAQLGDGWTGAIYPDDLPGLRTRWDQSVRDRIPFDIEFRVRGAAGGYRWFKTRAALIAIADGGGKWLGTCTDIHDRKAAEEELREANATLERRVAERTADLRASEGRFQAIFHTQSQFIGLMATDGTLLEANRTALAAAGVTEEQVLGRPFWETAWWTHDPAQQARLREAVRRAAAGEPDRFEASHPRADGTLMWVDFSLTPHGEGGRVEMLIPEGRDVTERKRAEEALRASEEQFRNAFDHAPIGMALVAPDGRWLRVNRSLCETVGYAEAELLATDFQTLTHPDDLTADLALVRQVLAGTIPHYQMEKRYLHKDGHVVDVLLAVSLVRDETGAPRHFISQIKDISARKAAVASLRTSEERLRLALEGASAGCWSWDAAAGDTRWDDQFRRNYGFAPDRPQGMATWLDGIHPDDRPRVIARVEAVRATPGDDRWELEFRSLHPERGVCWHHGLGRCERDAVGRLARIVGIDLDVTARKRAEERLRASEERFRVLFEQSSDAHLIFTEADGILDCNPAAVAMLRCPDRAALLRLHPAELSPEFQPDGRRSLEKCVEMDATARRNGHHRFDWHHRRVDGDVFPCEVTLTPVTVNGVSALLVVWHDLTERVRAEAAVRASEDRFRAFMDNSPAVAWMKDAGGRYVYLNRRFEDTHRVRLADWLGKADHDVWPAALADELSRNDRAALAADRALDATERVPDADGRERVWRVQKFPLRAATGEQYVGGIALDVTDEQLARDRIDASLREKEVLLKEIHHRVKNNLQIISSLLHLQSAGLPDRAVRALFEESRGRVKSMALIHERLYRSGDLAGVDLGEYVRQLAADLYRAYQVSHETVRLDLDVTVPPLPVDVAIPCGLLLNEMITNCLKHAFRGRTAGRIGVGFRRTDGGAVVLSVADDGTGFPPGVDFRTTASFGLQLIHTLAEQLNGRADLAAGDGATVAVTFPAPIGGAA